MMRSPHNCSTASLVNPCVSGESVAAAFAGDRLWGKKPGFDPFYCQPGLAGSHEKGGVEGEVGRFRRTWLSPMPASTPSTS